MAEPGSDACRRRPLARPSSTTSFVNRFLRQSGSPDEPPRIDKQRSTYARRSPTFQHLRERTGIFRLVHGQRQEHVDPIHWLKQTFAELTLGRRRCRERRHTDDTSTHDRASSPEVSSSDSIHSPLASSKDDTSASVDCDVASTNTSWPPPANKGHGPREHTGPYNHDTQPAWTADTVVQGQPDLVIHSTTRHQPSDQSNQSSKRPAPGLEQEAPEPINKVPRRRRVRCLLHSAGNCGICRNLDDEPTRFVQFSKLVAHILKSGVVCLTCDQEVTCQKDIRAHECDYFTPRPIAGDNRWRYGLCPDRWTLRNMIGDEEHHPRSEDHRWNIPDELGGRWINAWCWYAEFLAGQGYGAMAAMEIPWPYDEPPILRDRSLTTEAITNLNQQTQPTAHPRPDPDYHVPRQQSFTATASARDTTSEAYFSHAGSSRSGRLAGIPTSGTLPTEYSFHTQPEGGDTMGRAPQYGDHVPTYFPGQAAQPMPEDILPPRKASELEELRGIGGGLDPPTGRLSDIVEPRANWEDTGLHQKPSHHDCVASSSASRTARMAADPLLVQDPDLNIDMIVDVGAATREELERENSSLRARNTFLGGQIKDYQDLNHRLLLDLEIFQQSLHDRGRVYAEQQDVIAA